MNEGSATRLTLVGLLPSVDPQVLSKAGAPVESFPTFLTHVGFLSSMTSLMFHES